MLLAVIKVPSLNSRGMPFFWADAERQAIRMKAKSRFVVFIGINPG
jgi:hypothetical protein